MQHLGYMAAAYALMWGAVLIYFVGLSRRERAIWAELQELRERLDRAEEDQPTANG